MNSVLMVFAIIIVISLLIFYGYNQNIAQLKPTLQEASKYIPSTLINKFPTGDIMTLVIQPLPIQSDYTSPTVQNDGVTSMKKDFTTTPSTTNNQTSTIVNANPVISNKTLLSATAGQTYGYTQNNKEVLPEDTFQLGTPVGIAGNLQMVIPNSCKTVDGQVVCQYVSPAIWKYLAIITCKIPENNNCAMDDYPHWGKTDTNGNYNFTWNTMSGSMNAGNYKITVSASSLVKQLNGQQYDLEQNKMVNLVP